MGPGRLINRLFLVLALSFLLGAAKRSLATAPDPIVNVMAPLFIGDPNNQAYIDALNHGHVTPYEENWNAFQEQLVALKAVGITGVSVDVWWGVVQKRGSNSYDWGYYRRLFETIKDAGLSVKVILSTHSCGSNVGDDVYVPLPSWIFKEIAPNNTHEAVFESEAGKHSREYISTWATEKALPYYEAFWGSFLGEFRDVKDSINSISISLGPSGELHYPSYHQHDSAYAESKWPNRGFFQGAGAIPKASYLSFLKTRYRTLDNLNRQWKTDYNSWSQVFFPQNILPVDFTRKLNSPWIRSQESIALFDWYSDALRQHLKIMLSHAAKLIWRDADFGDTPISLKLPGVHWEKNRLAELMNGLISVSSMIQGESNSGIVPGDLGYGPLFQTIADIQKSFIGRKFDVYTTAGSMPDGIVSGQFSRGQSIVKAQAALAKALGLILKLENAMSEDLYDEARMKILADNFELVGETGVTLLRLPDVLWSPLVKKHCENWLSKKSN